MDTPNIVHYFPYSHAWRRHAFLAMNGRKLAWAKTSQVTLWPESLYCVQFLTASYASLAVLGIAFRGRGRRQHFWKFAAFFQKKIFQKFSELF